MGDDDILAQVNARMTRLGASQNALGMMCGLSQGHLSKVLAGKLKLAEKTETVFRKWLDETAGDMNAETDVEIRRIVDRLIRAPASRRMQILQLLRIVERLAE